MRKIKLFFRRNSNNGFTLTELLIVISLISFLILMAVVTFRTQIFKSQDARRKADVRRIGIAVEEYEKDNNCYPLSTSIVCNPGDGLKPYLDKIPCDPTTKSSYYYEHEDTDCPSWYRFYAKLENTSDVDYVSGMGPAGAFSYEHSSANAPAPTTTETPPEGGSPDGTDFYGCFSGACVMISWDPDRPGPVCDPNFQNPTCYGQCGNPANECGNWN